MELPGNCQTCHQLDRVCICRFFDIFRMLNNFPRSIDMINDHHHHLLVSIPKVMVRVDTLRPKCDSAWCPIQGRRQPMSSVLASPSTINKDSFTICDTNVHVLQKSDRGHIFQTVSQTCSRISRLFGRFCVTMLCAQWEYKKLKFASGQRFSFAKLNFDYLL